MKGGQVFKPAAGIFYRGPVEKIMLLLFFTARMAGDPNGESRKIMYLRSKMSTHRETVLCAT